VDYALQNVGVPARGDRHEEVPRDRLAAPSKPGRLQPVPRLDDGLRPVEKDPAQRGVRAQDGRQERAVAAAHVDDRPEAGEVAGGGDRVVLLGAAARHRGVENGGRRRVARQEGEEVRPVDPTEAITAQVGGELRHDVPGAERRTCFPNQIEHRLAALVVRDRQCHAVAP
jgi:hypothetical protein